MIIIYQNIKQKILNYIMPLYGCALWMNMKLTQKKFIHREKMKSSVFVNY